MVKKKDMRVFSSSSWSLLLLIIFSLILNIYGFEEKFCPFHVEIRNDPTTLFKSNGAKISKADVLKCTIVDGDFTISMVQDLNHTNEAFPVFEHLREITGALLIYSVKGLKNLNHIFPNLRIIGGQSLILNYALVIYQNDDFQYLGLDKLVIIRNGGVRIADNPKLCFARSINWDSIVIGKIHDIIIDSSGSSAVFTEDAQEIQSCNDEHGCKVENPEKCHKVNGKFSCWNSTTCQTYCPYHKLANNKIGPGCSASGERCHASCLGGCEIPNDPTSCYACQKFELNGQCVDRCPPGTFEYKETRCVTAERCHSLLSIKSQLQKNRQFWKAFNGKCHYDCPDGYQEDPNDAHHCIICKDYCPRKCQCKHPINSIGEAMRYSKCSVIEGNLEITVQNSGQSAKAEEFTKAFGNIREITGFLQIRFSPTFTSLHMFKSLEIIHGEELVSDRYALSVMELENLRQLFSPEVEKRLQIKNGLVSFQNNIKLCYNRIMQFVSNIDFDQNVTDNDVSKYSNGEKAICEEVPLPVIVTYVNYFGFTLDWKKFDTTDMDQRKFLGYLVYYKKVDNIDTKLQVDDDRSACGDSWKMKFLQDDKNDSVTNVNYMVEALDPNSIYAYYVQTKTVHHPGARNAISKIGFVKTLFSVPEMPRLKRYDSLGPNKIILEWDPPVKGNGIITHYTVMWNAKSIGFNGQDPCGGSHLEEEKTSTMSAAAAASKDTCPADKGCCKCNDTNKSNDGKVVLLKSEGENEQADPSKSILLVHSPQEELQETPEVVNSSKVRTLRSIAISEEPKKPSEKIVEEVFPEIFNENITFGRANISTTRVVLTGLHHLTEYYIQIIACQDITVPENHCSKQAASRIIRTKPIPENDVIDAKTIKVFPYIVNGTEQEDSRLITWKIPADPNGAILGFRFKIWKQGQAHHNITGKCIGIKDFIHNKGVLEPGLSNGIYSFQVHSVSSAGKSEAVIVKDLFEINVPGWLTWDRALYIALGFIIIVAAVCWFAYWHYQRNFGKKVQDYILGTISANPDYFTHLDVYQIDEWELKREDIKLYDEIGRGTFGKVYLGEGKNIISKSGVKFGKCAVKTIPESSSNAERLHFLIEASVMKNFNTAYIVKLYGVVSEGQPVLVVMEMMDQGNLRDYLRARRPNSEENVNNAPLPTMISYFKWAAQIADGMAYLESLKFCHRDLAARNCMVAQDETVKIGDFGMARDIYYHEYYKPAGKRLMPVRWMAPESLRDGKFTVKSDIWSYGIVLYEMLTLGQQPYAGLGNDQVYNYIEVRRNILLRPLGCPDFWYDLMRICWKYDSRERPSFYQILLYLRSTIDTSFKEFPEIREEGMKVFERSFVITNFEDIKDEYYDFTYDEEEEDARKHTMLKELERMAAQENEHLEYYKSAEIDPNSVNNNDGGNGEQNIDRDEDEEAAAAAERFQVLTLENIPQTDLLLEGPPLITKKQRKEREKKREKFNKRQEQLEKEWQKKEQEEENGKKYAEIIAQQQQKAPLLTSVEPPPSPSSHAPIYFSEDATKDRFSNSPSESQPSTPKKTPTSEVEKQKSEYTEIQPLTKS